MDSFNWSNVNKAVINKNIVNNHMPLLNFHIYVDSQLIR